MQTESDLLRLQREQYSHDRRNHTDILGLSNPRCYSFRCRRDSAKCAHIADPIPYLETCSSSIVLLYICAMAFCRRSLACGLRAKTASKPLARKTKFLEENQRDFICPAVAAKIFRFRPRGNHFYTIAPGR